MKAAIASSVLMATALSTTDKVRVTLYYESQCPFCRKTITGSFADAYKKTGFLDMADIMYIPYGNASESRPADDYDFKCQHGASECAYNMIETCALNIMEDPLKAFNFINCVEENNESMISSDYDSVVEKCTEE